MRLPIHAKGMMTKKTVRNPMVSVHPGPLTRLPARFAENVGHTNSMTTKPTTIPATTPTSKIAQAISFRVLNSLTSGWGSIVVID